eukprot:401_1
MGTVDCCVYDDSTPNRDLRRNDKISVHYSLTRLLSGHLIENNESDGIDVVTPTTNTDTASISSLDSLDNRRHIQLQQNDDTKSDPIEHQPDEHQKSERRIKLTNITKSISYVDLGNTENEPNVTLTKEDIAKMRRLRTKAIQELVTTEKTYVDGLEKLITYFINPLKTTNKVISNKDHQLMFPSDLVTIHAFHIKFNSALVECTSNWNHQTSQIGHLFIEYGELFKLYQSYMLKYDHCIHHLHTLLRKNSKFSKWSVEESKKVNGLTIESLLVLPIQRLPRYEMLLKEIIKQTERYHTDLYDLKHALDQVCEVTELINAKMHEHDRRVKANSIKTRFTDKDKHKIDKKFGNNASRILVEESKLEDAITKHDKTGNRKKLIMFILNDSILYGYDTMSKLLSFGGVLFFDELFDIQTVECNALYGLKVWSKSHSIWISFDESEKRLKWMQIMQDQSDKYQLQQKVRQNRMKNQRSYESESADAARNELHLPYPLYTPCDFSDVCMICNDTFSAFKRKKQHCNYCGTLCCKECLTDKCVDIWKMYFHQKAEMVKVCATCKEKRKEHLQNITSQTLDDTVDVESMPHQTAFDVAVNHARTSQRHQKRRLTIERNRTNSLSQTDDKLGFKPLDIKHRSF